MSAFRVEPAANGIVHLVMDDPVRKVNVLDEAALASLESALGELEQRGDLAGVVLRSGKAGSFIAGADIGAIGSITDREVVHALITRAHAVFNRLAALACPTVAAIDGVCLGGGTEIALACHSRIAADEPRTQIGLPEVLLGIIPGFGGTTRLPRLVGMSTALDLILTGRALDARRAEKAGLVARAVPGAWLLDHAHRRIDELRKRSARKRRDRWRPKSFGARLLDGTPFGRATAISTARKQTLARTGGHYPAPLAAIKVLELTHGRKIDDALAIEASWASDLVVSPVCKNLVRIFQLTERAKKDPAIADPALKPARVEHLALVGAGVMGGGIAEIASRSGVRVRVRDLSPDALTRALRTADDLVRERRSRRRATATEAAGQLARITPALDLAGLKRADFAIEAVVEDLDVKRRVLAELEVRVRSDAVLATNTSSLSVNELAAGLERPDRFCGLHFFNPVHRMPLVEVVRGDKTSDGTMLTAVAFARRMGKTPVVVRDAPGFVVNRILMPYLREGMHLLEESYGIADIDASMRKFGMPMGPFEVVDEVGLDVAHKVAGVLSRAFPDRMQPAPALQTLIGAGRLGRKSGSGFYRHAGGKRTPDPAVPRLLGVRRVRRPQALEALSERMVLAMINEAARCLEEGVVEDAGMLDLAMIFGAGFPPFRGGLLRYADSLGLGHIEARLTALRAEKGPRFAPARLLSKLVAQGWSFTGNPAA